jgi:hypothetical protein
MTNRTLSFDEQRAAEAAFRGEGFNPEWTAAGQRVYQGIVGAMALRDSHTPHYAYAHSPHTDIPQMAHATQS